MIRALVQVILLAGVIAVLAVVPAWLVAGILWGAVLIPVIIRIKSRGQKPSRRATIES